MAWTEAPASGESRRSTVIPHAFRHRVSSRLYQSDDFVDGRNIPKAVIGDFALTVQLCASMMSGAEGSPVEQEGGGIDANDPK